jgi:hypothetical protein
MFGRSPETGRRIPLSMSPTLQAEIQGDVFHKPESGFAYRKPEASQFFSRVLLLTASNTLKTAR